jgi:hypothetical protein
MKPTLCASLINNKYTLTGSRQGKEKSVEGAVGDKEHEQTSLATIAVASLGTCKAPKSTAPTTQATTSCVGDKESSINVDVGTPKSTQTQVAAAQVSHSGGDGSSIGGGDGDDGDDDGGGDNGDNDSGGGHGGDGDGGGGGNGDDDGAGGNGCDGGGDGGNGKSGGGDGGNGKSGGGGGSDGGGGDCDDDGAGGNGGDGGGDDGNGKSGGGGGDGDDDGGGDRGGGSGGDGSGGGGGEDEEEEKEERDAPRAEERGKGGGNIRGKDRAIEVSSGEDKTVVVRRGVNRLRVDEESGDSEAEWGSDNASDAEGATVQAPPRQLNRLGREVRLAAQYARDMMRNIGDWAQSGSARRRRRPPRTQESKEEEEGSDEVAYTEEFLNRLVDKKIEDNIVYYQVEWADVAEGEDRYTWEPVENLQGHEEQSPPTTCCGLVTRRAKGELRWLILCTCEPQIYQESST